MQVTFDKEVLAKASKWVVDIIDQRNDLGTVRMEVKPNGVRFSSMSSYGERSIRVDADVKDCPDAGESFELPAQALKKIPSQAYTKTVAFRYDSKKDKTKVFVNGGVRFGVQLMASANRSVHGPKGMTDIGSLVPADLFNVVRQLSPISDPNGESTLMQGLSFDVDGKGVIRVMSTDSYVFSVQDIHYDAKDDSKHRFLLSSADLKGLLDADDATDVELYVNDNSVLLVFNDGRTARVNQVNDNYANYNYDSLIFRQRDDETFTVDRKQLQKAVSNLSSWNAETDVLLHIAPSTGVIVLSSEAGDWTMDIPMSDNTLGKPFDLAYNKSVLLKTLRASERDELRGRFVRDAPQDAPQLNGIVWDQLKPDGSNDESVYLLSQPVIKDSRY